MLTKRSRLALLPLLLSIAACSGAPAPSASQVRSSPPTPSPTTGATPSATGTPTGSPASPPATASPSGVPSTSPSASTGGGLDWPRGGSDLVIRVESGGGLMGPQAFPQRIPGFSLYGDGRAIAEGAVPAIFPGPLMPAVLETRISEEGMRRLLEAARSAGLRGARRQLDFPNIMDATTTTFTVVTTEGRHETAVYALHEASGMDGQIPANDRAARAALQTFASQVADLRGVLADEIVTDERPYEPTAMRVYARKAGPGGGEPGLPLVNVPWPLGDLATFGEPTPGMGGDMRCAVVDGSDLATVLPLFRDGTQLTRWISEGVAYEVLPRPLLPDETGCR
jgi:hypothetical protein